ncbi:hypothetical protein DL765_011319 [Monosporascus sp. GIB2]|nr:hypothetical protein DL765_011319 [Monosporascus sp. GIB2]
MLAAGARAKTDIRTIAGPDVVRPERSRQQMTGDPIEAAGLEQHEDAYEDRREKQAAVLPENQLRGGRAARQLLLRRQDERQRRRCLDQRVRGEGPSGRDHRGEATRGFVAAALVLDVAAGGIAALTTANKAD